MIMLEAQQHISNVDSAKNLCTEGISFLQVLSSQMASETVHDPFADMTDVQIEQRLMKEVSTLFADCKL